MTARRGIRGALGETLDVCWLQAMAEDGLSLYIYDCRRAR